MPRKDPITGCMVVTTAELFADEAEREGKGRTGGDLMVEMLSDLEKERAAEEERLRDPVVALDFIKTAIEESNKATEGDYPPLPIPLKIVEVLEAKFFATLRTQTTYIRALARRPGLMESIQDVVVFHGSYSGGSFCDPPDSEENVYWVGLDDEGKEVQWKDMYTIARSSADGALPHAEENRKKCKRLMDVIEKAGIRVRINMTNSGWEELQVDREKVTDAVRAVGWHILGLDAGHPLFSGK